MSTPTSFPPPTSHPSPAMSHQNGIWLEDTHASDGFDKTVSSTELLGHTEQPSKRGPPKEEWDRNRTLITQIYLAQNKTLGEVMRYMKTEMNFIATEKMYKIRIRQWGIDKKFKRREAIAMLVLRNQHQAAGELPKFTLRGREISLPDLERYARRAKITFREIYGVQIYGLAPDLTCQVRPPTPSHPRSPDHLHQAERIVHVTTAYLKGSFDQSICCATDYGWVTWRVRCRPGDLQRVALHFKHGLQNYQSGKIQDAMAAWRLTFLKSEVFLETQNPLDWLEYLRLRKHSLKTIPPEVATAWVGHVRALVKTQSAKESPHCSFAKTMCSLNDSDADIALSLIPKIMLDTWKQYLDPTAWSLQKLHLAFFFDGIEDDSLTMVSYDVDLASFTKYQPDSPEVIVLCLKYWTTFGYLKSNRAAVDPVRVREFLQAMIGSIAMFHDERLKALFAIKGLYELASLDFEYGRYASAKAEWEACLKVNQTFQDDYSAVILTDDKLYDCYHHMNYISNHSDIADGDQRWRLKIQAMKKKWEEELVTAVGDLTLDIAN